MFTTVHRFYSRLLLQFISLLCMLPLLPGYASGQAVNESWTALYSAPNYYAYDNPGAMALDAAGNVYIAGTSRSSTGISRVATIKYDPQGNQVWAVLYGTNATSRYAGDLQVDGSGNIFLIGSSGSDTFVIKYDANGNQLSEIISTNLVAAQMLALQPSGAFSLVGVKDSDIALAVANYDATGNLLSSYESTLSFSPGRIKIDALNNILLGGTTYDTNFHTGIAIARYDLTCNLLWETNYDGVQGGDIYFGNFTTDTNGNTFLAGYSVENVLDLGKIILLKYGSQGDLKWISDLGKGSGSVPDGIEIDGLGNLFLIQEDFATTKCNDQGTKLWQSQPLPAGNSRYWNSIPALDRSGNLYISGTLLKPNNNSSIGDRVTLKFDTQGHEVWAQTYYSPITNSCNFPTIIKVDDANNVYVTGYTFDPFYQYHDDIPNSKYVTTRYSQTNVAGLPSITHDPESVRATAFTTITFNVSATGDTPLTYQWISRNPPFYNAELIPGATNSTLVLTNIAENAGGTYAVIVSNSVGWIKSREASLILDVPPVIDQQPVSLLLASGESAFLQMFAHGDLPMSFQWQYNGTNLSGATNATIFTSSIGSSLVLSNISLADEGDYSMIVSNSFGMATSAVARVRVSRQINYKWVSAIAGPTNGTTVVRSGLTATDAAGNIYLSGAAANTNGYDDYLTVKMDSTGRQLWSKRYSTNGVDYYPTSMVLDRAGNVYVTGDSWSPNQHEPLATVKYDTDGNLVWVALDQGTNGYGSSVEQIAVDGASNVFVASTSYDTNGNYYYTTTKYDSNGQKAWQVYAPPIDSYPAITSLALDQDGNVLVAGNEGILKYSSSGIELWRSSPKIVYQLKTDDSNNVYALTFTYTQWPAGYGVEKYDSNGHLLWSSTYTSSGPFESNGDHFRVGGDGSVYVGGTATIPNSATSDFLTVKSDPNGQILWAARFSEGSNSYNRLTGLAIDDSGHAYVTGTTFMGGVSYITTLKYDNSGNQLWVTRSAPEDGVFECMDINLANQTNIFVTAAIATESGSYNYSIIAYQQNDMPNPPMILVPPRDQMLFINSNAVLSVSGGGGSLHYQWRHFGDKIPGATNSTLTIPNFQPQDGGEYSVILDNGTDVTISPEARLTPYTQLFSPSQPSPGQFSFTLVGEQSRTFEVQRSSDLVTWDSWTNLFNADGVTSFTDTSLTNGAKAFYRAQKMH